MKKDKQQPEKGQLTNEEYLDLYGSKDNMYLKARISTNEYFKLPEDKRRFYVRFCGPNEVFYTLNPMTSPFSVTIPKVEDQAPLSNETKAVESIPINCFHSFCTECGAAIDVIPCEGTVINIEKECSQQFKNTDAVKVIKDRITELMYERDNYPKSSPSIYRARINEANDILKLIQP